MNDEILQSRIRRLNQQPIRSGPVVYWMNRDQRIEDNWAFQAALRHAETEKRELQILFILMPYFLGWPHNLSSAIYRFMGQGLARVRSDASRFGINLVMKIGMASKIVVNHLADINAGVLYCDFSPLRSMRSIRDDIARNVSIAMFEVDAHNIVPAFLVSDHQEWGAYTLRPKLTRLLPQYLIPCPAIESRGAAHTSIDAPIDTWLDSFQAGEPLAALRDFIDTRLSDYHFRNNPNLAVTSRLSAAIHFGQLSAARVAIEVAKSAHPSDEFLEELIVRRELADNFCLYNPQYDGVAGFPSWARKTLDAHRKDPREYIYTLEALEQAQTHDPAWNAAQLQMTKSNYMHGYMRMYWAKKILEWTPDPETALRYAIYLNDKYELDGRDPSGYAGIAWAIGGVHDRPWGERSVFGMVRYMNMSGLRRKFGIEEYIAAWNPAGLSLL